MPPKLTFDGRLAKIDALDENDGRQQLNVQLAGALSLASDATELAALRVAVASAIKRNPGKIGPLPSYSVNALTANLMRLWEIPAESTIHDYIKSAPWAVKTEPASSAGSPAVVPLPSVDYPAPPRRERSADSPAVVPLPSVDYPAPPRRGRSAVVKQEDESVASAAPSRWGSLRNLAGTVGSTLGAIGSATRHMLSTPAPLDEETQSNAGMEHEASTTQPPSSADDRARQVAELQTRVDVLQASNDDLSRLLAREQEKAERAQDTTTQQRQEMERLEQQIALHQAALHAANRDDTIAALTGKIGKLEGEYADLRVRENWIGKEADAQTSRANGLAAELDRRVKQLDRMKGQLGGQEDALRAKLMDVYDETLLIAQLELWKKEHIHGDTRIGTVALVAEYDGLLSKAKGFVASKQAARASHLVVAFRALVMLLE